MIEISIRGIEPVAKGRPRMTKSGHTYTPKKTKMFEEVVRLSAIAQMRRNGDDIMLGPVHTSFVFAFEPPKSWPKWKREAAIRGEVAHTVKPDADNLVKAVKDALNGVAWVDDSQVSAMVVHKVYMEEPGIAIAISGTGQHSAKTAKKAAL